MTMPISFFKNSDELDRINSSHTGSRKSKVVVVTVGKDNNSNMNHFSKNLRGLDGMEKQT